MDSLKLRRLRVQFGLTIEKFWEKAVLDSGTAKKFFKGGPASLTTIVKAAKVFGIVNHLELLHPDELLALGVDPDVPQTPRQILEWDEEPLRLTDWERTANGLQYQVAKLRHRFLKDRFAKGQMLRASASAFGGAAEFGRTIESAPFRLRTNRQASEHRRESVGGVRRARRTLVGVGSI